MIVRLEATINGETDVEQIMNLKRFIQQFGPSTTVNVLYGPDRTTATLWIGGLPLGHRSLVVGTLETSPISFKILNGDTS